MEILNATYLPRSLTYGLARAFFDAACMMGFFGIVSHLLSIDVNWPIFGCILAGDLLFSIAASLLALLAPRS
jgi:hypothetical protein